MMGTTSTQINSSPSWGVQLASPGPLRVTLGPGKGLKGDKYEQA